MHSRLSRRSLLVGTGAAVVTTAVGASPVSAAVRGGPSQQGGGDPMYAYVGSRTTEERNARGVGITVWRVDPREADWQLLQTVTADDGNDSTPPAPGEIPVNPSFLTLSADHRFLYSVHGDDTRVSAFAVAPDSGHLTLLNTVDTGRRNPAHLTVDPSGRWLVVGHLAAPGSVASLPIETTGRLGGVTGVLELPGTPGPHKTQQLGPGPHHVPFDPSGRWVVVPDKGLDRIFVARLDPSTGQLLLNEPGWVQTRELEGPRHVAFHPRAPRAYVVNELRSTVTTYAWDVGAGTLEPLQVLPSTPPTMTADSRAAEVAVSPSGQYVYVSNRSGAGDATPGGPEPDTIGVFAVDPVSGTLSATDWVSTEGIRPRFFGLDLTGRRLYAANEVSDTIVGFELDSSGGRLSRLGVVASTGSPVSIVFRPAQS
jgi:6-phosphogluconolactonase